MPSHSKYRNVDNAAGISIGPGFKHVRAPREYPNLLRMNNAHRRIGARVADELADAPGKKVKFPTKLGLVTIQHPTDSMSYADHDYLSTRSDHLSKFVVPSLDSVVAAKENTPPEGSNDRAHEYQFQYQDSPGYVRYYDSHAELVHLAQDEAGRPLRRHSDQVHYPGYGPNPQDQPLNLCISDAVSASNASTSASSTYCADFHQSPEGMGVPSDYARASSSPSFFLVQREEGMSDDEEVVVTSKQFACGVEGCGYFTDRKNNLGRHMGTMHQDMVRQEECCGAVFYTKSDLRAHINEAHADGYVCEWPDCGKISARKSLLDRHYRTHTGDRCFKCPVPPCEYASVNKSNVDRHVHTHVPRLAPKPERLKVKISKPSDRIKISKPSDKIKVSKPRGTKAEPDDSSNTDHWYYVGETIPTLPPKEEPKQ